jgi:hypothetical protein
VVDEFDVALACIESVYVLTILTYSNYFTSSGGSRTRLNAGDLVSTTQTIYIYNQNEYCNNQSSFKVSISQLLLVADFTEVFGCNSYTLTSLNNGSYYTESNGQGALLNGEILLKPRRFYIYVSKFLSRDLFLENNFTINVLGVSVDKRADVIGCETYTLPELTVENYFSEPGGNGNKLFTGDLINETQKFYIYAENADLFFCSDSHKLTVTIANTTVQNFEHQEVCESFTLSTLDSSSYDIPYYRGANGMDLISPSEDTIIQFSAHKIYAKTYAIGKADCFAEEMFNVVIKPLRELVIEGAIICVDPQTWVATKTILLESFTNPNLYAVQWFLDNKLLGQGTNHEATEAGIYTVKTLKLSSVDDNSCNYKSTEVEVKASSPEAKITFLTAQCKDLSNIRGDFVDEGFGAYEYQ